MYTSASVLKYHRNFEGAPVSFLRYKTQLPGEPSAYTSICSTELLLPSIDSTFRKVCGETIISNSSTPSSRRIWNLVSISFRLNSTFFLRTSSSGAVSQESFITLRISAESGMPYLFFSALAGMSIKRAAVAARLIFWNNAVFFMLLLFSRTSRRNFTRTHRFCICKSGATFCKMNFRLYYFSFRRMDHSVLFFIRIYSCWSIAQKKLEAVELVDFARTRIVVDGGNIRTRETTTQFLYHALSSDMVWQTRERLHTGDARYAAPDKLDHFSGKEPSFTRNVAKLDDVVDA